MKYFSITEIGPRKENQDRFSVLEKKGRILCCVADGVGGVEFGGIASDLVVSRFKEFEGIPTFSEMELIIKNCHQELVDLSKAELKGRAATTFTCAVISDKHIYGIHVGDSRASIIRLGKMTQLTEDHTEAGRINKTKPLPHEYNALLKSSPIESVVGIEGMLKIQRYYYDLKQKDRIVLSTDGFHDIISASDLESISYRNSDMGLFKNKLQIEIENRILKDNLTVIIVDV